MTEDIRIKYEKEKDHIRYRSSLHLTRLFNNNWSLKRQAALPCNALAHPCNHPSSQQCSTNPHLVAFFLKIMENRTECHNLAGKKRRRVLTSMTIGTSLSMHGLTHDRKVFLPIDWLCWFLIWRGTMQLIAQPHRAPNVVEGTLYLDVALISHRSWGFPNFVRRGAIEPKLWYLIWKTPRGSGSILFFDVLMERFFCLGLVGRSDRRASDWLERFYFLLEACLPLFRLHPLLRLCYDCSVPATTTTNSKPA